MQQAFFAPNHDFGASSCSVKLTLPETGFYTDVICAAGARCRLAPLMGKRGFKFAEITGKKQAAFRHDCSVFADVAFFSSNARFFCRLCLPTHLINV